MKKTIIAVALLFGCVLPSAAQIDYVSTATYTPLSYEEIYYQVLYDKQMADRYLALADECYDKSEWQNFLNYTDLAMSHGFYRTDTHYKRGVVYEVVYKDFKHAKKEYKKAIKDGYYVAQQAYDSCVASEKEWKAAEKARKKAMKKK